MPQVTGVNKHNVHAAEHLSFNATRRGRNSEESILAWSTVEFRLRGGPPLPRSQKEWYQKY
eukprot:1551674-Amphidinium_carterae.1